VNVPGIGEIEVFGLTALFDRTSASVTAPPPALGQHNAEILGRLGYGEAELGELKQRAVI
jgi:crotonobetainyl-CoA:carnitine CoA-transferase CaiB-like acyl-CoA transferase